MKKILLTLFFPLLCNMALAQNSAAAEKLVEEGVAYHDKGDFEGAIAKYDKALELDKDNLLALTEKAFSLTSMKKYDEAVNYCQRAITTHVGEKGLRTVYVNYGNALDGLKKTDKSIEVYEEGIKQFPDYYQLYFNKGVTLTTVKKYDEALICFQSSAMLNPKHASSHSAIARITSVYTSKRIPSILAYCRFLVIEPQSERAKENLERLQKLMMNNVEQTGKKSITINVSPEMLADTTKDGKRKENSFTSTDLVLAFSGALDFEKKNKKKTEVELFLRKFETVCASLSETKKDNFGFYWEYYVPYFVEMKEKNLLEAFSYIAFASSDDKDVAKWLKSHGDETDKFYEWSKLYKWKSY